MNEARTPRYTDVPCPKPGCYTSPGWTCTPFFGSHRKRRQLWEAMAQAQERHQPQVWWHGGVYQTPLRQLR